MQTKNSVTLLIIGLLLFGGLVAAAPASAHDNDFEPRIHIAFEADGTAYVSIVDSYNLEDTNESETYTAIKNSEERQQEILNDNIGKFETSFESMENSSNRDIRVVDSEIEAYETDHETDGLVVSRIQIENLGIADSEAGTLTITEPLSSHYTVDRRLTLVAPSDEYNMTESSPQPDALSESGNGVTWLAGSDGDFDRVVFEIESSEDDTTAPDGEASDDTTADEESTSGDSQSESPETGAGGIPPTAFAGAVVVLMVGAILGGRYYLNS